MSTRAGIELARERLTERPTLVALVLGSCFALGVTLLELAQGRIGAADRALTGGVFGIALPLVSYFLVTRASAGSSLREALLPLSRHGLDRRALTFGLALPPAVLSAAFASVTGLWVVVVTRGFGDAQLASDAFTTFLVGLVAGPTYVAAFVGASAYGRRGQGRSWLLAADFLLGAGDSFLAFPWPKGHVRSLLGGSSVVELSQLGALIALLGTSFAFLWLGTLRNQR